METRDLGVEIALDLLQTQFQLRYTVAKLEAPQSPFSMLHRKMHETLFSILGNSDPVLASSFRRCSRAASPELLSTSCLDLPLCTKSLGAQLGGAALHLTLVSESGERACRKCQAHLPNCLSGGSVCSVSCPMGVFYSSIGIGYNASADGNCENVGTVYEQDGVTPFSCAATLSAAPSKGSLPQVLLAVSHHTTVVFE